MSNECAPFVDGNSRRLRDGRKVMQRPGKVEDLIKKIHARTRELQHKVGGSLCVDGRGVMRVVASIDSNLLSSLLHQSCTLPIKKIGINNFQLKIIRNKFAVCFAILKLLRNWKHWFL